MAYDKQKAHEYYVNYKKKGLKKGRKKGKKTTTTTSTAFLGVSAQGLNDDGRAQAALIKEQFKKEMKNALASAKTDEERQQIRLEYSKKTQQAINELKSNSQYAKAKAQKTSKAKSAGSSKSSTSKSSAQTAKTAQASKPKMSEQMKTALSNVNNKIKELISSDKINSLSESERADLKEQLQGMLAQIYKLYK